MRKLREEKGFAMAELLAVCIVVLGIFAILFSNYLPLTAEYENRVTYNNVNAEYAATYIRKIFKDVKVYDALKGLDSGGYYTLYSCNSEESCDIKDGIFTKSDGSSRNNTYDEKKKQVTKFINEYGIQEIIITKYKTKEVKEKYSEGGLLYNYIKSLPSFSDSKVTKTGKYRIILKTKDYGYATVPLRYAEPNEPKLDSDMLPVYYDNGSWKVADKTNESVTHEWYDYVEKKWANAVKLSSGSVSSYKAGEVVSSDKIKSMWVWIPKYKYKEFESDTVKQIDVTFVTQDNEKDDVHPAFGGKKSTTTGFWVGKYEMGNSDQIKKGISVLTGTKNVLTTAIDGIGAKMISDAQWNAIVYLSYSKYGLCNDSGVCDEIGKSNSLVSGNGGSSNNNFYGVYDMNGGAYEYIFSAVTPNTKETQIKFSTSHSYSYKRWCTASDECSDCKHSGYSCYYCGGWVDKDSDGNITSSGCYYCSWYVACCQSVTNVTKTSHTWFSDMIKDKYSTDSYDVRGGSKDGNVWCMELSYNQFENSCTTKVGFDSNYRHCSNNDSGNYTGILAYSNSNYIDKSLISSRAVINK